MNDSDYQELLEASWRRKLTPAEETRLQAWLAVHSDKQSEWEAEAGLNQLIAQLPDAPVASNFTARVVQQLDRETAAAPRPSRVAEWCRRMFLRPASGLAWAAVLIAAGWLGYHQLGNSSRRERAQDLVVLLKSVGPEPTLFVDFDAIHKLPQADDEELYAVLSVQQ